MGKLHELLAVEGPMKSQIETVRTQLSDTFKTKHHLFIERQVTFHPIGEEGKSFTEAQLDLQTTVMKELDALATLWTRTLDVSASVAETNTAARGDVEVDGMQMFTHLPATALLELEKRLGEIQAVISHVPTLDPAKGFRLDEDFREKNVYRSRDDKRVRTEKVQVPIVLYDATEEHPAQTQIISRDEKIGDVVTQEWSGMITPSRKFEILDRCERMRQAVKQARARANGQEVIEQNIGARLFRYIIHGTKT